MLLRLSASLNDTVILLVRSGTMRSAWTGLKASSPSAPSPATLAATFRWASARVLVILANLPDAEREEVLRYNLPRIQHYNVYDEVYMRTEINRALSGLYRQKFRLARGHGRVGRASV